MADTGEAMANSVIEHRAGAWAAWRHLERSRRLRIIGVAGSVGLLTLLFVQPLARILGIALQNDLHSYIALVPVISGYLLYTRPRKEVVYRTSVSSALTVGAIGAAAVAAALGFGGGFSANDS